MTSHIPVIPIEIQNQIISIFTSLPRSEVLSADVDLSLPSQSISSLMTMLTYISSFYKNRLFSKNETELRNQIRINNEINYEYSELKQKYKELKQSKSELNSLYQQIEKENENNIKTMYYYKKENEKLTQMITKLKSQIDKGKSFKTMAVKYVEEEIIDNSKMSKSLNLKRNVNNQRKVTFKENNTNLRYSSDFKGNDKIMKQSFDFSKGCQNYFKENECFFVHRPIHENSHV